MARGLKYQMPQNFISDLGRVRTSRDFRKILCQSCTALQSTVMIFHDIITVSRFEKLDTKACKYLAKKPCPSDRPLRGKRDCTVFVVRTKALISCSVTVQLICAIIYAYALRFSHNVALFMYVCYLGFV